MGDPRGEARATAETWTQNVRLLSDIPGSWFQLHPDYRGVIAGEWVAVNAGEGHDELQGLDLIAAFRGLAADGPEHSLWDTFSTPWALDLREKILWLDPWDLDGRVLPPADDRVTCSSSTDFPHGSPRPVTADDQTVVFEGSGINDGAKFTLMLRPVEGRWLIVAIDPC